jgi:nitroimidazol reductase NimA-like FMN-containing flavoprotein (pyridoxamine 5'-phosphate oxidase superfamily)
VPGFRLSNEEIWAYVRDAHTGILTTLRRDGMPIAMPMWFATVDRAIYVNTRGKKVQRARHDPRASFLVETGVAWRELQAVHFTGSLEIVEPDPALLAALDADMSRKYDAHRTDPADMPEAVAAAYGAGMKWLRFSPDQRVLSWNNRALMGDTP